jgi:hypothetical protein
MRTILIVFAALLTASAGRLARVWADETIEIDTDTFAAIAYSPSTGEYRYAYGYRSREGAQDAALRKCTAEDARMVCWVKHGFCALALGDDKGCWGTGWRFGDGAENIAAAKTALAECEKRTTGARLVLVLSSDGQHVWKPKPSAPTAEPGERSK